MNNISKGGSSMFPFRYALNASTLFPYKLGIRDQLRIAAEAGYEGLEIWMRDLEEYVSSGGSIAELKAYAESLGIEVPNAIAFFRWADEDESVRQEAFAQAGREMRMLAELGCPAVAAPPYGSVEGMTLEDMAACYKELVQLGRSIGVEPYLEFWGRAERMNRLADAAAVAMLSGVPDAKLLLDPFHMYTGGSMPQGIGYLRGDRIGIVHVNDWPASPPRETIADRDRVFPGDGAADSEAFAALLHEAGYSGFLSLELFIEDFEGKSALDTARLGREKIEAAYSLE